MIRKSVFLLLLLALAAPAFAANIKNALNQQYKKHVLALRSPFASGDQKFDSSGQPRSRPGGKWLLYGGVYVEKINLSAKNLRLEGHRVGFGEDKNKKQILIAMGKSVKLEIQLDRPLKSADQAQALMDRVFISRGRRHGTCQA